MPAGMLLLSPWVDLSNRGWRHSAKATRDPFLTSPALAVRAKQYLGEGSANLAILDADLRGLPPTFIQTGEAEILMSDSTARPPPALSPARMMRSCCTPSARTAR